MKQNLEKLHELYAVKVKAPTARLFAFMLGLFATTVAYAAPDGTAVNAEANEIGTFIHNLLSGDVGYLFSLTSFLLGIIGAIATQKWVVLFGGFAIGVAILIIPSAMQGLFTVTFS